VHWAWWLVIGVLYAILAGVLGTLVLLVYRLARAIPGRAAGLKIRLYLLLAASTLLAWFVALGYGIPMGSFPRGSSANAIAILVVGAIVAAATGRREGRFHPLAIIALTFTAAFAYVAAWGQNHFVDSLWAGDSRSYGWYAYAHPVPFVDTPHAMLPAIVPGALSVICGLGALSVLLTRRKKDRGRVFALCAVVIPPCFGWTLYECIWRPVVTPPELANRITLPRSILAHEARYDPDAALPVLLLFADGGVGTEEGPLIRSDAPPDDVRLLVFLREAAAGMQTRPLYRDSPSSPPVPDDPILIQADEAAPLVRVLEILSACREAGIWRIKLGTRNELDWAPGYRMAVSLNLPTPTGMAELPPHASIEIRAASEGDPGELEYALGDRVAHDAAELREWVLEDFGPEPDLALSAGPGATLADGLKLLDGLTDERYFSGLLIPSPQP